MIEARAHPLKHPWPQMYKNFYKKNELRTFLACFNVRFALDISAKYFISIWAPLVWSDQLDWDVFQFFSFHLQFWFQLLLLLFLFLIFMLNLIDFLLVSFNIWFFWSYNIQKKRNKLIEIFISVKQDLNREQDIFKVINSEWF